ncbi:MAG: endolytic transglycosylase MltG [candidate division WOR-3 bacterium]|nr:endolytic transglycosylase MltG [candidate division WOR-3 bacterium]
MIFSRRQYLLVFAFIIISATVVLCDARTKKQLNENKKKIIIYPGESAKSVATKLLENGIIRDQETFLFWAKILGCDKKIKSGRYYFNANTRALKVLRTLTTGGENKTLVVIPEGYTIKDIARILHNEGICSENDFIKECHNKTFLLTLNIKAGSAEGYLFPDSYDFIIPSDPKDIIRTMVNRFWQVYQEIHDHKPLDTVLIIASLVEKEAKLDSERPLIASVFYNRLKNKMPLQSCATVQYVLPVHKEQLSVEDTKINSPYNTYLHQGLPPTPICNPGKASLIAAIRPANTKYLYFAVNSNGKHFFSKTFSEHQKFLRSRKK